MKTNLLKEIHDTAEKLISPMEYAPMIILVPTNPRDDKTTMHFFTRYIPEQSIEILESLIKSLKAKSGITKQHD